MKKSIKHLVIMCLTCFLVAGVLTAFASDEKAGGYSHLDENGKIDFAGYFKVEGAKTVLQEESLDFVMNGNEATFSFNKVLAADGFALGFNSMKGNTLQKVEVILTDSENADEKVAFTIFRMNAANSTARCSNSDKTMIISGSLYSENDANMIVGYDVKNRYFTDNATYTAQILESLDGTMFSGFSSNKVNLTVRLTGAKGSVFRLKEINMQRFGTTYAEDSTAPGVTIVNPLQYVMLDSVVTLPQAFAMDVLAERATMTMTVTDPDGEELTALDGTKLTRVVPNKDYQIKIEKRGYYRIAYQATDGTNKTRTLATQFSVLDQTKPVIKVEEIPTTIKVGDTITLPKVTVMDNVSAKDKVNTWIDVKYPDGHMKIEKKEFKATQEGVYFITYFALDEAGNLGELTIRTYAEGE